MVFQSGALFDSLTIAENIAFPLDHQPGLTDEDIKAYVLKLAKMLEVEEVMEKFRSEFSTGMNAPWPSPGRWRETGSHSL